jgi:hypothetical protein
MLKLEKKLYSRDCTVSVRGRPVLWNKDLLTALALTLLIHGVFFFLFDISPFRIRQDGTNFAPAVVIAEGDMDKEFSPVAALITKEGRKRDKLEPKGRLLQMPPLPDKLPSRDLDLGISTSLFQGHSFQSLENSLLFPDFPTVSATAIKPPISILIAGPLASNDLLSPTDSFDGLALPLGEYMIRYAVQVEDRTGFIFWHSKIASSGNKEADMIAERLLERIRFRDNPSSFATSGEIEIVFRSQKEGAA